MFADMPPRLRLANDSPAEDRKKYYSSHLHQDFIIQVNEKLEAWDGCTYPLSSPISEESSLSPSSSSSSTRRSSTTDGGNPYDLYGPPTDESATPSHALFFNEEDSDRSAISSSPATSNSESGTPATSKFQTIALEAPYMDQIPPPAYREAPENPYPIYSDTMYHSRPCYIPFEYAKLPHFHPPRFSRRLRNLIAERRRPMTIHLLPLQKPQANEKQGWVIGTPDSTLLPTPKNVLRGWWESLDPRLVVLLSLMTMMLGIFIIALAFTGFWK